MNIRSYLNNIIYSPNSLGKFREGMIKKTGLSIIDVQLINYTNREKTFTSTALALMMLATIFALLGTNSPTFATLSKVSFIGGTGSACMAIVNRVIYTYKLAKEVSEPEKNRLWQQNAFYQLHRNRKGTLPKT